MSSTLASRLFDDLSFRSSSFILFCIIMVFLVIFSPGRPMRSAHGIHCRKMHLTYYKIDLVHYRIKTILDTFFFHIKNLTYDILDIAMFLIWGFLDFINKTNIKNGKFWLQIAKIYFATSIFNVKIKFNFSKNHLFKVFDK